MNSILLFHIFATLLMSKQGRHVCVPYKGFRLRVAPALRGGGRGVLDQPKK